MVATWWLLAQEDRIEFPEWPPKGPYTHTHTNTHTFSRFSASVPTRAIPYPPPHPPGQPSPRSEANTFIFG